MSDRGGKNALQADERRSESEKAGDASGVLRFIFAGVKAIMHQKSKEALAQLPIGEDPHHKVPDGYSFIGATAGRAFYVDREDGRYICSAGILYAAIDEGGKSVFPPDESGNRPVTVMALVDVESPTTRVGQKYRTLVVFYNGEFAGLIKSGFTCAACGKLDARKVCGGCAEYPDTPTHAAYCSKSCQKAHWRVHKHVCAGSSIRRT